MKKVRPLTEAVLKKIEAAAPPAKFPRGYFDPLVVPTRKLLDKGLRIHQAADFFVENGSIKANQRQAFMHAMRCRISRLTRKKVTAGNYSWQGSLFYDSSHLVSAGERKAICGATATVWVPEVTESNHCARCTGLARKNSLAMI